MAGMFLASRWTTPADASILVSAQSTGAVAPNAFTGFTSPAGTIALSGGTKFFSPNPDDGRTLAVTTAAARDVELTTYPGGRGNLIIRLAGVPGAQTGLYMTHNNAVTGGDVRVGIVTGYNENQSFEGQSNATLYPFYVNSNVMASTEGIAAGYSTTFTTGDHFTFGANGFEVYLQFNGHDLVRYTEWRRMEYGRMLVWTHPGFGATDITAHYLTTKPLYSRPQFREFHPFDFGMRAVAAVTGSITGATNSLLLAHNVGFAVGDQIIVEVGGEAGAGLRGTEGVGGSWPPLKYATATAMNADTGKADGTWAADSSTGFVYTSASGVWSRRSDGGGIVNQGYYSFLVVPEALVAKVTAVSGDGLTLTLNTTASATATNANVYLDCLPSYFVLTNSYADLFPVPQAVTMKTPAGSWALSGTILFWSAATAPFRSDGVRFLGAGRTQSTLFAPRGAAGLSINLGNSDSAVIRDLALRSNHGDNGYGFRAGTSEGGATVACATWIGPATGGLIQNIDFTDVFGCSVELNQTVGATCQNCTLTMTHGQLAYSGWQFQSSNGTNNLWQDITVTAVAFVKAFETFNGDSDQFIRCGGQNVGCSTNSSGGWLFGEFSSTLTTGCRPSGNPQAVDEQVMTISAHAFPADGLLAKGGTIRNPRIVQQGYTDSGFNVQKAIQVESTNPGITIAGQYPEGGAHTTAAGGYFSAPSYNATSPEYGNLAIMIDATGCTVTGIRVDGGIAIGTPGHSNHFGNISTTQAGTVISSCVADAIHGGSQSSNQSNSGY